MPKQIHKIDQFHGGLNTNSDSRDIADNELSVALGVMVDELGSIRTLGGTDSHDANTATSSTINPGYGLFYFSHDRKGAHVIGDDFSGTHTAADSGTVMTDSAATFPVDGLIGATINNTTDGSSGTITDNDGTTVTVASLTGGSDNSWDDADNDAYTITDFPETGDDYLLYSDSDTTGKIHVYSSSNDTWGSPITGLTSNVDSNNRKDTFYSIDGAVRISDAEFGNNNANQWYGYINRTLFREVSGQNYVLNRWYQTQQKLLKPSSSSVFDNAITTVGTVYSDNTVALGTGTGAVSSDTVKFSTGDVIYDLAGSGGSTGAWSNVSKIVVNVQATLTNPLDYENSGLGYSVRVGEASNSTTFTADIETDYFEDICDPMGHSQDFTFTFNASTPAITIANGELTAGVRVLLTDITNGSNIATFSINTAIVYEGNAQAGSHAILAANNVHLEMAASSPDSGTAIGWNKDWNVGVSFVYDEKQEGLIRELADVTDGTTKTFNVANSSHSPTMKLLLTYSTSWNPRITGINVYLRESSTITTKSWYLQSSFDLVSGTGKPYPNGNPITFDYDVVNDEYYCILDNDTLLQPNLVDSYEIVSGVNNDEDSIISKYKTAVVVGRTVYIGNVQVEYEDSARGVETKGDAMLKSPVNKFDIFPLSSVIEASVNDGDDIIKLEEYADRILQFKKRKMHLINVSQGIEFLEDTFMHKGVDHPSAVCKTDYGVAWVNRLGCYLYDGKQVINLLEKGGRQIIKESDWEDFLTAADSGSGSSSNESITSSLTTAQTGGGGGEVIYYNTTYKPVDSTDGASKPSFRVNGGGLTVVHTKLDSNTGVFSGDLEGTIDYSTGLLTLSLDVGAAGNAFDVTYDYDAQTGANLTPMIGYIPKKRQLVIVDDNTTTGDGDIFLYDLVTQSWVKGDESIVSHNLTNFITDWNGDLVYANTATSVLKWSDNSVGQSNFAIRTKDIDFGEPGRNKKLYKVLVTYDTGNATSNVHAKYIADGLSGAVDFVANSGANFTTPPELDSANGWEIAELKPDTSSEANNKKSFKLIFITDGIVPSGFKINDISLIYRMKSIK